MNGKKKLTTKLIKPFLPDFFVDVIFVKKAA
ncbi:MAG: hypothetical protein ACI9VT_001139 [Psychroserpens sp.]|jgi:hypothetical protein